MCRRFEDGLNEDIKVLVGILELKEFVVLVDRALKAEELNKERRKAAIEARDVRKRQISKPFQSQPKRSKETNPRMTVSIGDSHRDRGRAYSGSKAQATSVASVGNVRPRKPECQQCGRQHYGECWGTERACFRCGSREHFIRDCPEKVKEERFQSARQNTTASRGRPPRNTGGGTSSKTVMKDLTARSEARAPARAYAIRAREDARPPR
ncbi:hypothetical protein PVK06_005522 [Gossypium arboreum]|uniref:CCHC-type domain-containing protein n=1 Tax=Gossypium arboreum TaxID=29729 RepID=A0ABR0QUU2_GOSAR|nr:hypothetical protein PVK06_005522 [Gossypium arboreum]